MKKILLLVFLIMVGCKETGIHIIDNPDGTSVKVSYWDGNDEDNQPNIIQIGNRCLYMQVTHNVNFLVQYGFPLIFDF